MTPSKIKLMKIRILSPELISQISAGEIIERPASIVKEALENSLDSGATNIHIDIEKSGLKSIRIRDNGYGIEKEELSMALMRHATSKIYSFNDLKKITTLGFRGEALASICSISRLTLISRTKKQKEGWQAYTEGENMEVTLKPIAHPYGTTLEILDLFYNTPARRKFLRSEKTEFYHINQIIRRFSLICFNVNIFLNHNGKLIQHYPAINNKFQIKKRINIIFGNNFLENALHLNSQNNEISLTGWLKNPIISSHTTNLQYFYVNERIIHDRLFNHAIREAFYTQLKENKKNPTYVLYLKINPNKIDINVHPTKYEIRFQEPRIVHDFIYQSVINVLKKIKKSNPNYQKETEHFTSNEINKKTNSALSINHSKSKINVLSKNNAQQKLCFMKYKKNEKFFSIIKKTFALIKYKKNILILSLPMALFYLKKLQQNKHILAQIELINPVYFKLTSKKIKIAKKNKNSLQNIGINIIINPNKIGILYEIPLFLQKKNLKILILKLLNYLSFQKKKSPSEIIQWIIFYNYKKKNWNYFKIIDLLKKLEYFDHKLFKQPPSGLLKQINLKKIINELKHENKNNKTLKSHFFNGTNCIWKN